MQYTRKYLLWTCSLLESLVTFKWTFSYRGTVPAQQSRS